MARKNTIHRFIARKDGGLDWLENINAPGDNEDYGFYKFLDSVDALIMGRNTYEIASSVKQWPYPRKRVVVLSSTLKSVREEAELFNGKISDIISTLQADGIKHVYVDGGVTICQFLNAGLIDTLTISIIPVILGKGIPLFSQLANESRHNFISSTAYPNGLVQLSYESA